MIPYGKHSIDENDVQAVADILRSDFLTGGPAVELFEKAFSNKVQTSYTMACSSGTAALHLALLALDIGEGDSVVVPSLTFLATANAVRLCGADVIFSDVDPDTGLMTLESLEDALSREGHRRPKVVIPVHLNGQVAPIVEISSLAQAKGMRVVEDACHALGTVYERPNHQSVPVGATTDSTLACFSFHPVKTIAMGEGGAVTASDSGLADRVRLLRNHGMERREAFLTCDELARDANRRLNPWYYEMSEIGLNYRASDIHCALGLSQLGKFDQFSKRRKELAAYYDKCLQPLAPVVQPVPDVPGCDSVLHLYVVLIDFVAAQISRGDVMRALKDKGVGTQVHYLPVHMQPYYRARYGEIDLPGAQQYYKRCLSLPLYSSMEIDDVNTVVEALDSVIMK